jgi:hypothetical protein
MRKTDTIRVSLEVDPDSEPIGGRVTVAEQIQGFTGWVELVAAIEAARKRESTSRGEEQGK